MGKPGAPGPKGNESAELEGWETAVNTVLNRITEAESAGSTVELRAKMAKLAKRLMKDQGRIGALRNMSHHLTQQVALDSWNTHHHVKTIIEQAKAVSYVDAYRMVSRNGIKDIQRIENMLPKAAHARAMGWKEEKAIDRSFSDTASIGTADNNTSESEATPHSAARGTMLSMACIAAALARLTVYAFS